MWNLFQIERGADAKEMVSVNAGVIGGSLRLDFPAISVLQDLIGQLYFERGIFDDPESENFPILHDLLEKLECSPGINALVREAIRSRLSPLLGISGQMFGCKFGWRTEDLTAKGRNTLFELGGLSDDEQSVVMTSILAREFVRRRSLGIFGIPTNCFICFDDAQLITGQQSHLASLINVIGEMGLSLCLSVQTPRDMNSAFLGNCGTKILGPTADARDMELMCKSMGMLTIDQVRWLTQNLVPGLFLAKVAVGYTSPFLFRVPWNENSPQNSPTTEDVQFASSTNDLGFLNDLPVIEADQDIDILPSSWTSGKHEKQGKPIAASQTNNTSQGQFIGLTEDQTKLIRIVISSPGLTLTELTKRSGMGGSRTPAIRSQLIALGYFTIQKDQGGNKSGRGSSAKRIIPTKQAYEALGKYQVNMHDEP